MKLSPIFLIVHCLCLKINIAQGISVSKPGCPEKCGNVTIPYPFGIGSNCSANSWFEVICKNGTKPFLDSVNLEAVEFYLDMSIVRVLQPAVSSLNCSNLGQTRTMRLGKSFLGSPFTFSDLYNRLAVVGCKRKVWLMDSRNNSSSGGCSPICGNTTFGCNGINCCRTMIPRPGFQELNISYTTSVEGAFRITQIQMDMSKLEYVPMILKWEFHISEETPRGVKCDSSPYYSSYANDIYVFNNTRCYCDRGVEGNPYLPGGGCPDSDDNNQLKSTIIGICSGVGALLLLNGTWMSSKVIRKRIKANRKQKFFKRNGGLLLQQLSSNDGGVGKIKLFNSKELAQATDRYNDNRILGGGGQGTVYKGMLPDGRIVAVKKSRWVDEAGIEVFINEVVILSQINHRNIVKLIGCCLETENPLLVYEFIPNGTLFQHIHDQNNEFPLSWKMRVRIATEVAGALSYLHYAASAPIYHRDIKSKNILLDEKYRAKVSDFGISRSTAIDQTHLTTRVVGTFGYLDPEYFQSSQFTEKSDVYSFGVVMVELLTGEKAVSTVRAEGGRSLATHFLHSMEENHLFDILDPEVLKECPAEEIMAVADLARRCLNLNGMRRPTVKEVAIKLEGIQKLKEGSVLQSNHETQVFHSIDFSEVYDFASISDSTNLNAFTAASPKSPLLFGNS